MCGVAVDRGRCDAMTLLIVQVAQGDAALALVALGLILGGIAARIVWKLVWGD